MSWSLLGRIPPWGLQRGQLPHPEGLERWAAAQVPRQASPTPGLVPIRALTGMWAGGTHTGRGDPVTLQTSQSSLVAVRLLSGPPGVGESRLREDTAVPPAWAVRELKSAWGSGPTCLMGKRTPEAPVRARRQAGSQRRCRGAPRLPSSGQHWEDRGCLPPRSPRVDQWHLPHPFPEQAGPTGAMRACV